MQSWDGLVRFIRHLTLINLPDFCLMSSGLQLRTKSDVTHLKESYDIGDE